MKTNRTEIGPLSWDTPALLAGPEAAGTKAGPCSITWLPFRVGFGFRGRLHCSEPAPFLGPRDEDADRLLSAFAIV